jgi:hypothetical protein
MEYDFYPDKTYLAAGTATKGADAIPAVGMHIYLKRAPPWYRIPEDGVARYDEFPEGLGEALKKHQEGRS